MTRARSNAGFDLDSSFAAKAALASPALTGTPTAPTAAAGTNTTQVATTAFVQSRGPIRAWARIDGPTSPTILAGSNIASVSRSSTGRYVLTFSSALSDSLYGVTVTVIDSSNISFPRLYTATTSTFEVQFVNYNATAYADTPGFSVVVTR